GKEEQLLFQRDARIESMLERLPGLRFRRTAIVEVSLEIFAVPREPAEQVQLGSFVTNGVITDSATRHETQGQILQTVVFEIEEDVAEPVAVEVALVAATGANRVGDSP